jgi:hypothetical protein
MTIEKQKKQRRTPFLEGILGSAPEPGVLLGDPQAGQAVRMPEGTVSRLGTDPGAWERYYRDRYENPLQVPPEWLMFWLAATEVDRLAAWHALQRLLVRVKDDPAAQDLTVAEVVSALALGLMQRGGLPGLRRASILAQVLRDAH